MIPVGSASIFLVWKGQGGQENNFFSENHTFSVYIKGMNIGSKIHTYFFISTKMYVYILSNDSQNSVLGNLQTTFHSISLRISIQVTNDP